jgi:hypothetical protein
MYEEQFCRYQAMDWKNCVIGEAGSLAALKRAIYSERDCDANNGNSKSDHHHAQGSLYINTSLWLTSNVIFRNPLCV